MVKVKQEEITFMQDKRIRNSKLIFDGAILQLYLNELELDSGALVERELIHHKPAVAVLATTTDNRIILVKQFRPAVVDYLYEVPAGILDKGAEAATVGAARELEEETGYRANSWQKIASFYVSPGFLNEKITLYHATDLIEVENPLPQDDDEDVVAAFFTKEEIKDMLARNEIVDLKTLYAVQYWLSLGG